MPTPAFVPSVSPAGLFDPVLGSDGLILPTGEGLRVPDLINRSWKSGSNKSPGVPEFITL